MQSVQASQQHSRWLRWGRIVFLGLFLALIQIALFSLPEMYKLDSFWWAIPVGSVFFYLLIPGVEAFITAWDDRNPHLAIKRACLVGWINFLVILISAL